MADFAAAVARAAGAGRREPGGAVLVTGSHYVLETCPGGRLRST